MTIERRVRIIQDFDPINPRTDWDCHAGRMICWHDRYNLGDEHNYDCDTFLDELACENDAELEEELYRLDNDVSDKLWDRAIEHGRKGWKECSAYVKRFINPRREALIDIALSAYVILPLYLYDHSGITMSTGGFGCMWDSSQVGWIVCDPETIEKEFGNDKEKAKKCLLAEVEVYDQYLTGDTYGFIVEERETGVNDEWDEWVEGDSCWGFFGSDVRKNGMAECLGEELTAIAEEAEIERSSW